VQSGAERSKIVARPVKFNLGVFQFVGRLLTGREQQNHRSDKLVVRGEVGSFLGGPAELDRGG
jgi:hypothetical protein